MSKPIDSQPPAPEPTQEPKLANTDQEQASQDHHDPEPESDQPYEIETIDNFDDMGLKDDLLKGIYTYGFEKPSQIQTRAIIPLMKGYDIIGQAQSGTGKTGTFSIGTLQMVDPAMKVPQILVLEPTRELATQTFKVYEAISSFMGIALHCCIGGTRRRDDEYILKEGVHVIIGTPGRIYDLLRRRMMRTDRMKCLVLDEADKMLSGGFIDDVKQIFYCLPENIQVGLFSATMPPECLDITTNFMRNPITMTVKKEELTLEGILQYYVDVGHPDYKVDVICDLYKTLNVSLSIIFCSTIHRVNRLTEEMNARDLNVTPLHGGMSHAEREEVMGKFRGGQVRCLVTTDLVARGIDVQSVSIVVNFDLPNDRENYLHRIGRAGRFGRKGLAINLVTDRDIRDLQELERYYHTNIEPLPENFAQMF